MRRTTTTLELRYDLEGDIAGLAVPAPRASRRADRLWQHTCFEAFVGGRDALGYLEFNFSSSSEWAIYRFTGYRAGMAAVETTQPPRIAVTSDGERVSLQAVVALEPLTELRDSPILRLALAAVVEQADGRLSYWALAHPAGKPDFHHAEGFALELPSPPAGDKRG